MIDLVHACVVVDDLPYMCPCSQVILYRSRGQINYKFAEIKSRRLALSRCVLACSRALDDLNAVLRTCGHERVVNQ